MNKRQSKKKRNQKAIDSICINFAKYGISLRAVKGNPSKRTRKKCEAMECKYIEIKRQYLLNKNKNLKGNWDFGFSSPNMSEDDECSAC